MINLKTRAVILKGESIFLVKDSRNGKFMLPGGTYEEGETIQEAFCREIQEELGVLPRGNKVVSVREFEGYHAKRYIEFLFLVENPEDFEAIDECACTHGHEWSECGFYPISQMKELELLPLELGDYIAKVTHGGCSFYFD